MHEFDIHLGIYILPIGGPTSDAGRLRNRSMAPQGSSGDGRLSVKSTSNNNANVLVSAYLIQTVPTTGARIDHNRRL